MIKKAIQALRTKVSPLAKRLAAPIMEAGKEHIKQNMSMYIDAFKEGGIGELKDRMINNIPGVIQTALARSIPEARGGSFFSWLSTIFNTARPYLSAAVQMAPKVVGDLIQSRIEANERRATEERIKQKVMAEVEADIPTEERGGGPARGCQEVVNCMLNTLLKTTDPGTRREVLEQACASDRGGIFPLIPLLAAILPSLGAVAGSAIHAAISKRGSGPELTRIVDTLYPYRSMETTHGRGGYSPAGPRVRTRRAAVRGPGTRKRGGASNDGYKVVIQGYTGKGGRPKTQTMQVDKAMWSQLFK